jgi:hypothetical protein
MSLYLSFSLFPLSHTYAMSSSRSILADGQMDGWTDTDKWLDEQVDR